jgi:hypothetical protein
MTPDGGGDFWLIRGFSNFSASTTLDIDAPMVVNLTDPNPFPPNPPKWTPSQSYAGSVWMRYNELTGSWDAPIINNGTSGFEPNGVIYELIPQLQFSDIGSGNMRPFSFTEVAAFFGNEVANSGYFDALKSQTINFFKTKRSVQVSAAMRSMKIGDAVSSPNQLSTMLPDPTQNGIMFIKSLSLNQNPDKLRTDLLLVEA